MDPKRSRAAVLPEDVDRLLRAAVRRAERAELELRTLVAVALDAGYPQSAVGRALGVTRSAVHQRRRSLRGRGLPAK